MWTFRCATCGQIRSGGSLQRVGAQQHHIARRHIIVNQQLWIRDALWRRDIEERQFQTVSVCIVHDHIINVNYYYHMNMPDYNYVITDDHPIMPTRRQMRQVENDEGKCTRPCVPGKALRIYSGVVLGRTLKDSSKNSIKLPRKKARNAPHTRPERCVLRLGTGDKGPAQAA